MRARLRAVAEAIPPGASVADVGTGDGQLAAWLAARGERRRLIAVELAGDAYERAGGRLAGLPVECRRGDGLSALHAGEVDVAVLAGMGGRRIIRILQAAPLVVRRLDALVLQPMQHAAELRAYVAERFTVLAEASPVQSGRTYTVLVVRARGDATR